MIGPDISHKLNEIGFAVISDPRWDNRRFQSTQRGDDQQGYCTSQNETANRETQNCFVGL